MLSIAWLRVRLFGHRVAARSWARVEPFRNAEPGGEHRRAQRAGGAAPTDASPTGRGSPDPNDLVAAAYEGFQREIHSFALHATRDPDAAADTTHEAFIRLLREAQAGRAPDNVRAWLYRVASNLIINRARHARIADGVRRAWTGGEETQVSPEWLALSAERTAELRVALQRLPRDARVGLLLAANGFSGREVAEALGRTELATRSLLFRGRTELRRLLQVGETG